MQLLYEEDGELKVGRRPRRGAGVLSSRNPARAPLEGEGGQRAAHLRASERRRAALAGRKVRAGARRRLPLAVQRRSRVRVPRPRQGVRGSRAEPGGGRRRADQAAFGADVLLSARQGPLPGRAGADSEARARGGGEEKAPRAEHRRLDRAAFEVRLPGGNRRARDELLYAPDRSKPEAKALEEACRRTGLAPARLFERCGLLPDAHDYHLQRFVHEFFPRGAAFPAHAVPEPSFDLPLAGVQAFSLDDVGTTEIDDAFSLERRGDTLRVGIHIAAPALGFAARLAARRDSARAAVHRLHAGAQVHHASGGRDPALFARSRRRARRGLALRRRRAGLQRGGAPHAPRARAGGGEPAPRAVRPPERAVRARRRAPGCRTRRTCACSGASRSRWRKSAAGRAPARPRSTTASTSRTAACASCRASAARRSTSWSPR